MRRCVGDFVLVLLVVIVIVIEVWPQLANDEFRMSNDDGIANRLQLLWKGASLLCAPFLGVQRTARPTSLGHEL
jgi:hypothetical protein